MKTVVLANQKGGVGKTADACLLVHYLVDQDKRVLAIDLDHQGNFSKPLKASGRLAVSRTTADRLLTDPRASIDEGAGGGGSVLVPMASAQLLALERQPEHHNAFAGNFRAFLKRVDSQFDVCVVDTNPNPDIRVIAALVSAEFVLSPVQLNQEAIDGIAGLLNHERVGIRRIQARLNPQLKLIGILPTMVEPTPFQKANFAQIAEQYASLLIRLKDAGGRSHGFAYVPKRSAVAEAQAAGAVLWHINKTAARDAWKEIKPGIARIADILQEA